MLIVHKGTECWGCPFFSLDRVIEGGACEGTTPACNLDGLVPVAEKPLDIKIENPDKRPMTCPFELEAAYSMTDCVITIENQQE